MKYLLFFLLSCNPGQPRYEFPVDSAETPRQRVDTPFSVIIGGESNEGHPGRHGRLPKEAVIDSSGQVSYHLKAIKSMKFIGDRCGGRIKNKKRLLHLKRDVLADTTKY